MNLTVSNALRWMGLSITYFFRTDNDDDNGDGVINALDFAPTVATTRLGRLETDVGNLNVPWDISGLDYVTTEWNVRAGRANSITGFERLPLFVGHFADIIQSGVDFATIWTTQATGDGNGSLSEQFKDELTPTGYLFRMMKDALSGTRLADPSNNNELSRGDYLFTSTSGTDLGYSYTFRSAHWLRLMAGSNWIFRQRLSVRNKLGVRCYAIIKPHCSFVG
jgi:hypothetical protein